MKWHVIFYKTFDNKEPVKEWLNSFDTKIKLTIHKYLEKLESESLNLKHPYITHLETQLYEINIVYEKKIYKIIFFPTSKKELVLLHGFIKSNS